MRFVHAADVHIGSSRFIPNYLERQIKAAKCVFSKAKSLGVKTILFCGDLVEKDLKSHERDALLRLLLQKDDQGFQILIISGNHDMIARGYSNLRFLQYLYEKKRFRNLHIAVEDPAIIKLDKQDFLLFPGFCPAKNINKELKKWIKQCDTPPVVMMHEIVKGATADNGFKPGHGVRLDPDLGALYFACGDLHKSQRLTGIKNGFYCGSPCQHDFGEILPKGFLVVDTDKPTKPKFVEIGEDEVPSLVTIAEAKDVKKVRDDSWIRVQSSTLVDSDDLPDRVLKTSYLPNKKDKIKKDDEIEIDLADEVVSMKELRRFLKKEARLSGKYLKVAMKKAESYIAKLKG